MRIVNEVPPGVDIPFHRVLGIRMGVTEQQEGVAWVDVDPTVHFGTRWAHGGLVGALADIASGISVAMALGEAASRIDGTLDLKINFLRKVVDGDMTATARVLHLGKRIAVTEVTVTNNDTPCAKALATFMLRQR